MLDARFAKDLQRTPDRLGCTPEKLVTDGECSEIFRPEAKLANSTDGNIEGARDRSRCELTKTRFLVVVDEPNPFVGAVE
jgi:hypothetical protein